MGQGTLSDNGKEFFSKRKMIALVDLIDDIEKRDYEGFITKIKDDNQLALLVCFATDLPELRRKIIEALPDDEGIYKDKLRLLLEDDLENLDQAIELLSKIDLSKIGYVDSQKFLWIASKKEAWDFVLIFGEKLLTYEKKVERIVRTKLDLFNANFKLGRLLEAVKIGEEILGTHEYISLLDDKNKTSLLNQTVIALLRRNTSNDNTQAMNLIETYKHLLSDFESNARLTAEVYLRHSDAKSALGAVVRGVKFLRRPSPQEYASLFMVFNTIGNMLEPEFEVEKHVEKDRFIKFKEEEAWYYIGEGECLDAQPIPIEKHHEYIGKKIADTIVISNNYVS
ncbi:MAG: hypothetical protein IPI46_14270 [Bacteroidetes bacterium]|nr:hypothetical protein [Bacteroidota bacterium]